jgi:hypothetical protein
MKSNYPLVSKEVNNILLQGYENLVYLLGQEVDGLEHFSGLYEYVSDSGDFLMSDPEAIPTIYSSSIINALKYDYILRKNYGQIMYKENK